MEPPASVWEAMSMTPVNKRFFFTFLWSWHNKNSERFPMDRKKIKKVLKFYVTHTRQPPRIIVPLSTIFSQRVKRLLGNGYQPKLKALSWLANGE